MTATGAGAVAVGAAAVGAVAVGAASSGVTSAWGERLGPGVGLAIVVAALVWTASAPWQLAARRLTVRRHDHRRRWTKRARGTGPGPASRVEIAVVLDLVGAALTAGSGVPRALEATGRALGGPDGRALGSVAAALLLGAPWETAWAAAPARFATLAGALRPAWTHGSAPREALRVAGVQIRQDAAARAQTEAARLGVRLVLPLGLCFLPAFVLIGLVPVLLSLGAGVLE